MHTKMKNYIVHCFESPLIVHDTQPNYALCSNPPKKDIIECIIRSLVCILIARSKNFPIGKSCTMVNLCLLSHPKFIAVSYFQFKHINRQMFMKPTGRLTFHTHMFIDYTFVYNIQHTCNILIN